MEGGGVLQMMLQHPVITNMEMYGTPDGSEVREPRCPVCGEPADLVYRNKDGEIVGCGECLRRIDAWDCPECTEEDDG